MLLQHLISLLFKNEKYLYASNTDSMQAHYLFEDGYLSRIMIVDPFVDENGTRLEYGETPNPTQHNTICYSEKFYIN